MSVRDVDVFQGPGSGQMKIVGQVPMDNSQWASLKQGGVNIQECTRVLPASIFINAFNSSGFNAILINIKTYKPIYSRNNSVVGCYLDKESHN